MEAVKLSCLSFLVYVAMVSAHDGNDQFDLVWHKRTIEAKAAVLEAYHSNPGQVVSQVNRHVHMAMKVDQMNGTRRNLAEGGCKAGNPIDQCWRCDPKWADTREKLADCAIGFGKGTTGGKGGQVYVVNDPTDDDLENPKEGTLRHAVIQTEPLWITFEKDMKIKLTQELIMASDKTIDGRGVEVHICDGPGITVQAVKNVIIHNINFHDIKPASGGSIRSSLDHVGLRTKSDGDAVSIFSASKVWVDHCTFSNCADGLVDVVEGSTAITISNNMLTNHDHTMLFGASDTHKEDSIMQITVAFNHFGEGLVQRMPRGRFGFFHVLNNDYTHWKMYAIGGSSNPTFLSQGNRFDASAAQATKQVTKRDLAPESVWKTWVWKSDGDVFLNGAFFTQSGDAKKALPDDTVPPKPGTAVPELTAAAGFLKCAPGQPC